jgi:Beta xylosidase C-terminal Concanavalin A-like domain
MGAYPSCGSADVEELRGEIRKILESPGFAGARQLQAFLSYASEAVFAGRCSIEQAEIAREVLGRGDDFNPLDDPSVRKIASLLRQRLQRYYETDGATDPVIVSLPLRSYLPAFQLRDQPEPPPAEPDEIEAPAPPPEPRRRRIPAWTISATALTIGAFAGFTARELIPAPVPAGEFHLWTVGRDLTSVEPDLPKSAIRLGPEIGEHDEAVVRMRFRPTQPMHQAGLLIFDDVNNYVELGRIFRGRPFIEFASEDDGRYDKGDSQARYDPEAQTLAPLWLAIRRNGNEYRAFTSEDGIHWTPFGEPRTLSRPLAHARIGLYAFNGQTAAAPVKAVFDHLSLGPGLHDWPADTPLQTLFAGWSPDRTCPAVSSFVFDGPGIRFTGLSPVRPCTAEIVRPVPRGDWTVSTRVDFVPVNGLVTGLQVRGARGRFRVVRWNIDGPTVSAELVRGEQRNIPDFPGNPPLILRIECRHGILRGSFSRDDRQYIDLGVSVPLASLGGELVIGYQLGMHRWVPGDATPPLVYWIHQEIQRVHPLL